MKKIVWASILATQALLPATAWCAIEITPASKVKSKITATVKNNVPPIKVTAYPSGDWPSVMELEQPPTTSWGAPFEGQLRIMVKTAVPSSRFQVSLATQPTLVSGSKHFQSVEVRMQTMGGPIEQLIPVTPSKVTFQHYVHVADPEGSYYNVGNYVLKIRAQPPSGKPHDLGGTYTGKLSMIFEPVAQQP